MTKELGPADSRLGSLDSVLAGGARHGKSVKNGQPSESPLIQILRGQIKPQMPLGRALAESEIVTIEEWIRGLKPESAATSTTSKSGYWAFVKPAPQVPPGVKDSRWVRNDVDAFILRRLETQGLAPVSGSRSEGASPAALL